ncbi:MAG: [Prevotella sp.]|nr:[citrate (pro-3S)-lyase] ligase [Prevotella sp.]
MRNDEFEIRQLPLSVKFVRRQVESFLEQNGLRLEPMDYYAAVFEHGGEEILAGGGLSGNIIKCIAVKQGLRDAKLSLTMISHLISTATSYGIHHLKIYTKPENKRMFESLGFQTIAQSEHAILQENDHSLADYKKKLRKLVAHPSGYNGIIIMNANPFTKGHRYLIEQAARQVEQLFVMVVEEDVSRFPFAERKTMVEKGCADLPHVTVCTTGSYAVSSATFPTYFLKEINLATDTQIMLDLDLFASQIAPTLNIKVRFVGSEPSDNLTRRYNELMKNVLPTQGIEVKELPRLQINHVAVSASSLRAHLQAHSLQRASALAYSSTIPYLIADLACQSLQEELDLTPKPGLVDQHDSGAHHDMDYEMMNKSIRALRPYFVELALLGNEECRMKNEEWAGAFPKDS